MNEFLAYALRPLSRYGYEERLRLLDGKKLAFKEDCSLKRSEMEIQIRRLGFNIGMKLGLDSAGARLLVIDKDGPNQGPFAELSSPMTTVTARGTHSYFQCDRPGSNKIKWQGLDVDVLFNATTVLPPSVHPTTGKIYEWQNGIVRIEDLPLFPLELLEEILREKPRPPVFDLPERSGSIVGMRRWIGKVTALAGQGGDCQTYRVAVKICSVLHDFDEALAEILAWDRNNAFPPWQETPEGFKALQHKIRCALNFTLKGK